jgi:hypothetical protein
MNHPVEGVLRRLLDEPSGIALADRQHVHDCPQCQEQVAAFGRDAELVGAALAVSPADIDTATAWERLSTAVPARRPVSPRRWQQLVRKPAAGVLAFVVVLAGAGTAAANDWFKVFETEKVVPISLRAGDLVSLPDLSAYGQLKVTAVPDVHAVQDADAAARETGIDVPQVKDLPKGVTGSPVVQVGTKAVATFTFSAERAAQATGTSLPPMPAGLDGTSVRLEAGPGVLQLWKSNSGAPALGVGRAVAPTAFSSGVPFAQVRDYLLSLPGLSKQLADQLRTFDGSTFPLPLPADQVRSKSTEVNGVPATVVTSRDGTLAAVVWVTKGMVTVVAGSLDDSEVLSVATGLQ